MILYFKNRLVYVVTFSLPWERKGHKVGETVYTTVWTDTNKEGIRTPEGCFFGRLRKRSKDKRPIPLLSAPPVTGVNVPRDTATISMSPSSSSFGLPTVIPQVQTWEYLCQGFCGDQFLTLPRDSSVEEVKDALAAQMDLDSSLLQVTEMGRQNTTVLLSYVSALHRGKDDNDPDELRRLQPDLGRCIPTHLQGVSHQPTLGKFEWTKGVGLHWGKSPSQWKDTSTVGDLLVQHLADMPIFCSLASPDMFLRDLPWRELVEHVLSVSCIDAGVLPTSDVLVGSLARSRGWDSLEGLRSGFKDWTDRSPRLRNVCAMKGWTSTLFKDVCRPGAWLADSLFTELSVRHGNHRASVEFVPVGNGDYRELARGLHLSSENYSSSNNVGNVMEHIMWVALEEGQCLWATSALSFLLQREEPVHDTQSTVGRGISEIVLPQEEFVREKTLLLCDSILANGSRGSNIDNGWLIPESHIYVDVKRGRTFHRDSWTNPTAWTFSQSDWEQGFDTVWIQTSGHDFKDPGPTVKRSVKAQTWQQLRDTITFWKNRAKKVFVVLWGDWDHWKHGLKCSYPQDSRYDPTSRARYDGFCSLFQQHVRREGIQCLWLRASFLKPLPREGLYFVETARPFLRSLLASLGIPLDRFGGASSERPLRRLEPEQVGPSLNVSSRILAWACWNGLELRLLGVWGTYGSWSGWTLPGGHPNPGELPEHCARREFFEETTIPLHANTLEFLPTPNHKHNHFMTYLEPNQHFPGSPEEFKKRGGGLSGGQRLEVYVPKGMGGGSAFWSGSQTGPGYYQFRFRCGNL